MTIDEAVAAFVSAKKELQKAMAAGEIEYDVISADRSIWRMIEGQVRREEK
jgi:hypothetical protein